MLYEMTIPQFLKMLNNLNLIIEKAELFAVTKKVEMDVLLNSRLAADQFSLIRQIQIACDTAKLAAHRLTGKDVPSHADTEKTVSEIKERITNTMVYLKTFNESDFLGSESKHISQPRWEGKYLTGSEFVQHHVLPNFYFHMTTAYSILRHNGVEIGKKDYLGTMPYKK